MSRLDDVRGFRARAILASALLAPCALFWSAPSLAVSGCLTGGSTNKLCLDLTSVPGDSVQPSQLAGTPTAPSRMMPRYAAHQPALFSARIATRSPGAMPRDDSHPAARAAMSASARYRTSTGPSPPSISTATRSPNRSAAAANVE